MQQPLLSTDNRVRAPKALDAVPPNNRGNARVRASSIAASIAAANDRTIATHVPSVHSISLNRKKVPNGITTSAPVLLQVSMTMDSGPL